MNVTVENLPNCIAKLTAELTADEVKSQRNELILNYSRQARIPGFRPGKAPKSVIEKRYIKEITAEIEYQLLNKGLDTAIREQNVKFLEIKGREFHHETDGSAKVLCDLIVSPEFTLENYKAVEISVPSFEVTDELIDAEILGYRQRLAEYNDKEDAPAEENDIAVIDYEASIDGTPLNELSEESVAPYDQQSDYWIKVEEDAFLPGFGQKIAGMVVGSEQQISVTFNDDFQVESLRGKKAQYTVTLKGIKIENLPSISEIIPKLLPNSTEQEFIDLVKNQLVQRQNQKAREIKTEQILSKISSQIDFALPEDFLSEETQMQTDHMVEQGMQYGMSEDDVVKMEAEIIQNASARAEQNLRNHFILNKVAELEEIKVEEAEIFSRVAVEAYQQGIKPEAHMKALKQSGKTHQMRQSLLMEKVVDFLIEHAEITETTENNDDA